jgi:hypothetical protein
MPKCRPVCLIRQKIRGTVGGAPLVNRVRVMRRRWWKVGGLATFGTLIANHKSIIAEAAIYDVVSRTLEFVFQGGWLILAGLLFVLGALWLSKYMQERETLMLVAAANPRIASTLETRRQSRKPWGAWIGGGAGVAILLVLAYWCWERARFPSVITQLSTFQRDVLVTAYIPERWDKADPVVNTAFEQHMIRLNEYKKTLSLNDKNEDMDGLETMRLIKPNRKESSLKLVRLTKKGMRAGAYLVRHDPILKSNPQYPGK